MQVFRCFLMVKNYYEDLQIEETKKRKEKEAEEDKDFIEDEEDSEDELSEDE